MPLPRGTPANIRMNLIFLETRVIGLHFCRWYSMGLSSFTFVQWVPKDASTLSILQQSARRKRILTSNSHSRSFKVIHFAISHRPTRCSISPYNIVDLISEDSEEVATQIAKNCRRRQPHSHLTPCQEPPRISPYTLHFQKLELLAYIFVADSMGLASFRFVQWAPKDASFMQQSAFRPFKVIQGHPRSMILEPFESAYATSY